jgi:hypothetical protein
MILKTSKTSKQIRLFQLMWNRQSQENSMIQSCLNMIDKKNIKIQLVYEKKLKIYIEVICD